MVPPRITNVEFISRATHGVNGDTYWLGEHVEVAVTFSGKVQVNPGGTFISLWFGDRHEDFKGAHYHRGSGTDTLVFRYTVQAGDVDPDGVFIGAAPIGGSGTVTAAGTDRLSGDRAHRRAGGQPRPQGGRRPAGHHAAGAHRRRVKRQ